jgi:2-iminobutanoate/2-iminopropanoate deaminase
MKEPVQTEKAPAAIGPYSQGIVTSGRLLFASGQIAKHPVTGQISPDFKTQVEQCLENIKAVIEAAGGRMADVVKINAYLTDLGNFPAFNEVYARYFTPPYPARTTVGASLPGGVAQVEVDAIASLPR